MLNNLEFLYGIANLPLPDHAPDDVFSYEANVEDLDAISACELR